MLPASFPPRQTVYGWFTRLRNEQVLERLNHHLVILDRERVGREASPTAGLIDSQCVKTTEAGGTRGQDAGDKIKGRKCYALVDTDGRGLVLTPHSADIQDRDGGGPLLPPRTMPFPSSRRSSPIAAMPENASPTPLSSPSRSSARTPIRSASPSSQAAEWSNASSPGSTETAVWPRTSRPRSPLPRLSFTPPLSCCSHNDRPVQHEFPVGLLGAPRWRLRARGAGRWVTALKAAVP